MPAGATPGGGGSAEPEAQRLAASGGSLASADPISSALAAVGSSGLGGASSGGPGNAGGGGGPSSGRRSKKGKKGKRSTKRGSAKTGGHHGDGSASGTSGGGGGAGGGSGGGSGGHQSVEQQLEQLRRFRLAIRPEVFAHFRNIEFVSDVFDFQAAAARGGGFAGYSIRATAAAAEAGREITGVPANRCDLHMHPLSDVFALLSSEADEAWIEW